MHMDPPVDSFSASVGSAPDVFEVLATGGACVNDYFVQLDTSGGGNTPCYRLTISADKSSREITVSGAGAGEASAGSSSYSGGSFIYFTMEKTCSLPV